jgi:N-acetylglucosaminyldiphosphoundecaprenol N-acetyl-beta-D-mannosaminyltransferase
MPAEPGTPPSADPGPATPAIPSVRITGLPVTAVDLDGAVEILLDAPAAGHRLAFHLATTHTLALADDTPELRAALGSPGAVILPDGMPLVWVGRLRGVGIGRVCGLDLMPALVDRGRARDARHYLYGGAEGATDRLAATLEARFPGARFVGSESPPFRPLTPDEESATIQRINAARPDYVWVGLGTPKQDLWLARFRASLDAPALLAVGAAFEIVTGTRARAPRWMQRVGLEWLFRLILEPRRLWRRYAWGNTRFAWLVLRETVRGRRLRRRRPRS